MSYSPHGMGSSELVIVGAGGFGRETAELVRAVAAAGLPWELAGFVDDAPGLQGASVLGLPVLGPSGWVVDRPDVDVVVCLGTPRALDRRPAMVDRLALPTARYATLVHPAAVIAASVVVGVGTVIHATTVATADAFIGDHVQIMPGCVITHDDRVADFVTMGAGARLAGNVTVDRGAYVGSGALVREGVTIGAGALIGMGAVVVDDVPPGETWVGVPARRLAPRAGI